MTVHQLPPTDTLIADQALSTVTYAGHARMPTKHGEFVAHGYRDNMTGAEHLALVSVIPPPPGPVTVRVHSECLTGEALGSQRCECGPQLDTALQIAASHGGAVIYMRGHEGRGIGLLEKIAAYNLQDNGYDTLTANLELGWGADHRDYRAAADILTHLGIDRVNMLTNNPDKVEGLTKHGVHVDQVTELIVGLSPHNLQYMRTKAESMGHRIPATTFESETR